jgi:scyllo-inositol 2-dehydrogenase (NADP+)
MIGLGIVGLGRMGLSHLAIAGAHPSVEIVGVCDSSNLVISALRSYKSYPCLKSYKDLIKREGLQALLIATPTSTHGPVVRAALEAGLHVFVEKPFCLSLAEGEALASLAEAKDLVNQVGYHNRFVGTFREARRLMRHGAIGDFYHILAEAYGRVVIRRQTKTWRFTNTGEGGCLLDYASHAIDLMNFLVGPPAGVVGAVLRNIFSDTVDDAVYATLLYNDARSGQISVNWSDDTYRKMSTKITVLGSAGKLIADRQELKVHVRSARHDLALKEGWNVRNTTELTNPVWYYLRGEEYSAQIHYFVKAVEEGRTSNVNSFRSALETDRVIARIRRDASDAGTRAQADSVPMGSPLETERKIARLRRDASQPGARAQDEFVAVGSPPARQRGAISRFLHLG